MAETVKLPIAGNVNKKTATIVLVGAAGVGGVLYWRWRKSQAAAASSVGSGVQMVTDPAGNQCQTLGAYGYCPGTPEDIQAQDQAAFGSSVYGGAGYPGGGAGQYTDPNGNVCANPDPITGLCPQTVTGTGQSAITTNAQWVQEVDSLFPGYTQAVAMVLGGVPVTTAQKDQFLEAVGVFGQPPQGYPTPIQTTDTPGQPGTPPKVTVPNVVGERVNPAESKLSAAGLTSHTVPSRNPAHQYTVLSQNPKGGAKASKGSNVTLTIKEIK